MYGKFACLVLALLPLVAATQDNRKLAKTSGPNPTVHGARLTKDGHLTVDDQRISHPGYNADRGPASVYAVRVHWESWK